jgi:hypothetical protein
MKMKKLMTTFTAILISSMCFAQQLKTYNGNYDLRSYEVDVFGINPSLLVGNASYFYYEDENLQRIRSGKFNYNGKLSNNGASLSVTISGNYTENKKNGKWTVKQLVKIPAGSVDLTFDGGFKEGLPDGLWSSTLTGIQNGKTVSGTYTSNFSSNVLIGEFKMTTNDGTGNKISGSFDKEGYFTGKTILIKGGEEYQYTFNNGLLVSAIGRTLQSGNVFENYKINEEELAIFNQLMTEKDSAILDEIPFKIIDGENYNINNFITNEFKNHFKNASLFNLTGGDLSIDENGKYNWIGFKIRILEASETKTEKLARLKAEEERKLKEENERLARLKAEEERQLKEENERLARLKAEEINNLNSKAWESLLKKDYSGAIAFCEKGIELDDSYLYLKGNLAHGYLLNGEFEKAREIYLKHLGSNLNNETSWLKMIEMDFAEFESKGIKSEGMYRILYEVRLDNEEREKYSLLSENERFKQFTKIKKKASFKKFLNEAISN